MMKVFLDLLLERREFGRGWWFLDEWFSKIKFLEIKSTLAEDFFYPKIVCYYLPVWRIWKLDFIHTLQAQSSKWFDFNQLQM
jgi:hypothetical protein